MNPVRFISSLAFLLLPAVFIILLLCTASCHRSDNLPLSEPAGEMLTEEEPEPELIFGVIPDTYTASAGRIGRNELISGLLLKKGFSYPEIDKILANNSGSFNPRKVRQGNSYVFYSETDTSAKPSFLVYEHDNTLSHVFTLGDNPGITDFHSQLSHEIRFAAGTIESSLWEAVLKAGANPLLAVELSEIYAWTIDFFGLRKGDSFRLIYEEAFSDGKPAGITSINGVIFNHAGKDFIAIPFCQNDKVSYYDEDGNSLRKAFLKAPLSYTRISSGFSSGRMHPILKVVRPHHGVDYAAPVGTPVMAIGDGRVISATYQAAEGRIVRIKHNSVYSTAYMHLSAFARGLEAGKWVKQGEVIGYVGSSGLSTGPHLDFRFYKNGSPVDPLKVEAPPVEPVAEENMERYERLRLVISSVLYSLGESDEPLPAL